MATGLFYGGRLFGRIAPAALWMVVLAIAENNYWVISELLDRVTVAG